MSLHPYHFCSPCGKSILPQENFLPHYYTLEQWRGVDKRCGAEAFRHQLPLPSVETIKATRNMFGLLFPSSERTSSNRRLIKDPPANSSSPFFSLPPVADLIRATEHVASLRGTKRRREPDEDELLPSIQFTTCSRASKRRRTDSGHSSEPKISLSPPQEMVVETPTFPSVSSPPPAVEEQPVPYRTGMEPHAIGTWIAEFLNDRFSTSALLEGDDLFLTSLFMKQLSHDLIELIHSLNPANTTIFIGLVYLERLLRNNPLRGTGTQQERCEMMKRTFIMALHFAFVWMDDVPWSLSYICEKMDLTLQEAKLWEIEALATLEYNLAVSSAIALGWLDALEEHAYNINFRLNLSRALHGIFKIARDEFLESERAKKHARTVAPSPVPPPRLVIPPPPRLDGISRSRSPEDGEDLEDTTPSPPFVLDIHDEPPSPEIILHRSEGSSRTSWSRRVDSKCWEWYEAEAGLFPHQLQPQPVYPSFLTAVA